MSVVIAGGGLSGLSLAAHLAPLPVTVVDDGRRDLTALSWASWSDRPGLLDAAVSREFDRIGVHAGGRTRVLGLGRYRYRVVRGADLLRVVRDLAPGCEFVRGHVDEVSAGRVVVDGRALGAEWVFDSVHEPPPAQASLSFRGWHVRSDRPVFDPGVPTLFDFRTPRLGGASFVYVLPVDAHRALVEHTSFTRSTVDPRAQRAALGEYLRDVVGVRGHVVEREEAAVLPLSSRAVPRRSGTVLRIGTPAGLVKASTGYGYQRVQQDSAAIARSMRRHGHPFDLPVPPARFRRYDGAMLDVVLREPARLEQAFAAMFRYPTAEPALRFLDERTSPADELRMFSALPAGAFLAALRRSA